MCPTPKWYSAPVKSEHRCNLHNKIGLNLFFFHDQVLTQSQFAIPCNITWCIASAPKQHQTLNIITLISTTKSITIL